MLGRSEEAEAGARQAYATGRGKPWHRSRPEGDDALGAATEATGQAQARTAEHLLAVPLEQLRTDTRFEPVRPAPGRGACPNPLPARWTAKPRGRSRELRPGDVRRRPRPQALLAARERAKARKAEVRQKPERGTATVVCDGRSPLAFGTAISVPMTERGLAAPAAGGNVLAQWQTILTTAASEWAARSRMMAGRRRNTAGYAFALEVVVVPEGGARVDGCRTGRHGPRRGPWSADRMRRVCSPTRGDQGRGVGDGVVERAGAEVGPVASMVRPNTAMRASNQAARSGCW